MLFRSRLGLTGLRRIGSHAHVGGRFDGHDRLEAVRSLLKMELCPRIAGAPGSKPGGTSQLTGEMHFVVDDRCRLIRYSIHAPAHECNHRPRQARDDKDTERNKRRCVKPPNHN